MSFHGAALLQFDELKDLIASFAGSVAGKQRVLSCGTSGSREAAEADLAEAGEAIAYLRDALEPQRAAQGVTVRLRFDQLRDLEGILGCCGLKARAWTGLKSSTFSTCSPFRANIAPCSRHRQAAIRGWGVGRSR